MIRSHYYNPRPVHEFPGLLATGQLRLASNAHKAAHSQAAPTHIETGAYCVGKRAVSADLGGHSIAWKVSKTNILERGAKVSTGHLLAIVAAASSDSAWIMA